MPGASPLQFAGSGAGVLLLHDFAGTPRSVAPWAEALAEAGCTVDVPRLPGHGTTLGECNLSRWDDWLTESARALHSLRSGDHVFVGGLGMGAALALRLTQLWPDVVSGVMLAHPVLATHDWRARTLLPVLRHLVTGYPRSAGTGAVGVAGHDVVHAQVPLQALWSQVHDGWPAVQADLPAVRQPVIVFTPASPRTGAGAASLRLLEDRLGSTDLSIVRLHHTQELASLEHDTDAIVDRSTAFVRRVVHDGVAA
jgi:carboxylesterase